MVDKIPPQDLDIERAVLGAIMLERDAFQRANEILKSETFYSDAHQTIFRAMENITAVSQPIDILSVKEELRKMEELERVGGEYYVSSLTSQVVSSAHMENHCRIIVEKFIKREIIRVGGEMVREAYEDANDAFELLNESEQYVLEIRQQNIKKKFKQLQSIMVENFREIEALRQRDEHLTGVPSGYEELDMVTCGWQKTDLIILAARPSVGKTAFALNLARNAAMDRFKPTPVAFFSLEMSDKQLVNRILSAESKIWLWKLRNARLDDQGMKQLYMDGISPLGNADIYIDDTQSLNIAEFRNKSRMLVTKHKVGLIIVDYLQLMTVTGIHNREQQIAEISRQLKAAAKELNIPIIALAQMSRAVEQRGGDKEPQLSDLRESGSIEQDADVVGFLYRPTDGEIAQDATLQLICNVKIQKNRNGDLAKFIGEFQKEIQRWNYLKVVDKVSLKPLGNNWKPVPDLRNYTEPVGKDEPEDLPF